MRMSSRSLAVALALLLSFGCRTASAPPPIAEAPTPASAEVPAAPPAPAAPTALPAPAAQPLQEVDVDALYAQCRERVEGPEADGECSTDADCRTGGCSGEVCATVAAVEGLMGTCEVLPCFSILKECGCVEGRCSWSVGPPQPRADTPPIVLPPRSELPSHSEQPGASTPSAPE